MQKLLDALSSGVDVVTPMNTRPGCGCSRFGGVRHSLGAISTPDVTRGHRPPSTTEDEGHRLMRIAPVSTIQALARRAVGAPRIFIAPPPHILGSHSHRSAASGLCQGSRPPRGGIADADASAFLLCD